MSFQFIHRAQQNFPHRSNPDYAFFPEKYAEEEQAYRKAVIDELGRDTIERTGNDIGNERPRVSNYFSEIKESFNPNSAKGKSNIVFMVTLLFMIVMGIILFTVLVA